MSTIRGTPALQRSTGCSLGTTQTLGFPSAHFIRTPWNPAQDKKSPAKFSIRKAQSVVARASSSTLRNANSTVIAPSYIRFSDCIIFPAAKKPRAIVHFVGGAFIGAVPEVTYRECLLNGEIVVCNTSPEDVLQLPVFSIGHSNGALLQLLIGCNGKERLPKGNAVIAFNNKPAADAVPYFEQLGPITAQFAPAITAIPILDVARNLPGLSVDGLLEAASPLLGQYDKESLQSLQNFVEQIPLVLDQVSKGTSEFTPAPLENRETIQNNYSVKNTLLVQYKIDAIDETDTVENILKSRIEEIDGRLQKIAINGNHITPCVQDIKWDVGKFYTPVDAVGQAFRSIALAEIRETVTVITDWFEKLM